MVDLIGGDEKIVLSAEFGQSPSSLKTQGLATRVVKAGNGIQQPDLGLAEYALQAIDIQSILIDRYANDVETVVQKDPEGQEIAGFLDDDRITGPREKRTDKIQRLGIAAGHEQALFFNLRCVAFAQELGQPLPEPDIALALAVIEFYRLGAAEETLGCGSHQIDRQQVSRWLSDTKIYGAWIRRAIECHFSNHGNILSHQLLNCAR